MWYKVHYPNEYYAAFYSVRADDFDSEIMISGKEKVKSKIKELDMQGNNISTKDKAQAYIGLDMKTLQANKDKWIKTVVPEWLKKAKEKGRIVASL